MALRKPADATADETLLPPLAGTRAQALHRLQVGLSLLLGIVLIVGLANVIEERATQSEAAAVAPVAATTAPVAPAPANDPLADAGVLPAEAVPQKPAPPPAGDVP
ncbi:MAG: hypothetical protein ACEQR8_09215 [Cypionkella sp.]